MILEVEHKVEHTSTSTVFKWAIRDRAGWH